MNSTLQNKCEGMLVGLAVGDALGAPVEFGFTSDSIRKTWNPDEQQPRGLWTDDTSMALCLADSLIEVGGYDSFDVMAKYLAWRDNGYRQVPGMPFDIGNQTDQALDKFNNGDPIIGRNEPRTWSAGNGGIMRLAPTIIANANQPIEEAIKLSRISSRETHYSYEADAGAEIFGAMLWQALHYDDKSKIIDVAKFSSGDFYDDILERINFAKNKSIENELKDLGGYVVDGLKIAIWGFLHFDDFRTGAIEVIKLGGDTDTNAAIYGQLAGAYYGYDAIPKKWRDELYLGNEIREIADDLLAIEKMFDCKY